MALVGCPNCPGEDVNVLLCADNAARWRRLCSCERTKRRRCTRCVRDAECVVFRNHGRGPLPPLPADSSTTVQFLCSGCGPMGPAPPKLPPEVPQALLQPTGLGGLPGPAPQPLPAPQPHRRMHDHLVECCGCGRQHRYGDRCNFSGSTSECPHCHGTVYDGICFQDSCPCESCTHGRTHAHHHRRFPPRPETV